MRYNIGLATGDVTPPAGGPLSGFSRGGFHSATGAYHPLRVVAIAIDDGTTPILIISIEWIGFHDLSTPIRQRLSEATGLPSAQIILSATHTHCGPMLRESGIKAHGAIDTRYLQQAVETIVATALRAWTHRSPSTLRYGTGTCSLAMNRRFPDPSNPKRVQRRIAPNPEGPVDHEVPILTIETEGEIRGVLFSYACHPTSRGGLLFGGDYVGFAYDEIQEAIHDAQPCFLQGCAGDVKPRPLQAGSNDFGLRQIDEVREIGRELGRAVVHAIRTEEFQVVTGAIKTKQTVFDLQTEPVDWSLVEATSRNPDAPDYQKRWAEYYHTHRDAAQACNVPFEIQTVTLGNSLALITLAGEMTVEHGLRLKRDLRPAFAHVLPLAYTNETVGYVPVSRQFSEWGYEVFDANQYWLRTGRYLPETEDRLHAQIHAMLDLSATNSP